MDIAAISAVIGQEQKKINAKSRSGAASVAGLFHSSAPQRITGTEKISNVSST
jgi:hypothetical protein